MPCGCCTFCLVVLHVACCLCIYRFAQLCCYLTYLSSERQLNRISSHQIFVYTHHCNKAHWLAHLAQREVYLRLSYASSVCGVNWTCPSMIPRNMVSNTVNVLTAANSWITKGLDVKPSNAHSQRTCAALWMVRGLSDIMQGVDPVMLDQSVSGFFSFKIYKGKCPWCLACEWETHPDRCCNISYIKT